MPRTAAIATPRTAIEQRAQAWGSQVDISARSVLVTVLGDTVAPLGGTVWLSDLISMASPYGFNERLVRTSMFRLVSERWVQSERVGRRSQYSLTSFGRDEFTSADARIYRQEEPAWDGTWTMVFVQPGGDADEEFERLLRWRGFAELSRGVYAAPHDDEAAINLLVDQVGVTPPLVASARFADIAPLATMAPFQDDSGLAAATEAYQAFVDGYQWTADLDVAALSDHDAFVVRTMIVHDLRRVRLRDPELPRDLLPSTWPGDAAMQLASDLYGALQAASWRHIEAVTGLTVDQSQPLLTRRFAATEKQF